jgi:epoxyqueuosine reductase
VNLSQVIKEYAHSMGFSLAGITTCDSLPHGDVFNVWLDSGRHGKMAYLETQRSRECRPNPARLLPECRSVLVLGMRYPKPTPIDAKPGSEIGFHGKIAAYAWGEDYHHTLPGKLQQLVRFIELQVGHALTSRWYTDTGPLLERELAQRAGLGWIGKNTCLINPSRGSYFLLSEVLLGLELEPDAPFIYDRCGTCQRCITACPTGCIQPDRTIHASRCISYLTIELKEAIPAELRSLMNGWVFGCDVCQQVCPWNHFATPEASQAYASPREEPAIQLLSEFTLSVSEFNRKYHHSPIMRAKRRGYMRNIAVALGNSHNPAVVPVLAHALLGEAEPLVRAHGAWALGQIGNSSARQLLKNAAGSESDPQVKLEIQAALALLEG